MNLIKPKHLSPGDTIATVSPSWGCAGDYDTNWRYLLGKERLEKIFGLKVVAAPNSMRGESYLSENPEARAEDIIWAFQNKSVNAIIANIGGNDSIKLLPHIDKSIISNNPKIFVGYSDILNLHLLCYKANISSFYGPNLLPNIAEPQGLHKYTCEWFSKVFFDNGPIGTIPPSQNWTCDQNSYIDKHRIRKYHSNKGYNLIQGAGKIQGRLFGGQTGMMTLSGTSIELSINTFLYPLPFQRGYYFSLYLLSQLLVL